MSKRVTDAIPLAIVLVAVVVVGIFLYTTPDPVDTSLERICPYQTETPPCSYHWGN